MGGFKASPEIPTYLSIAVLTLRPTVPTGQAATEGYVGRGRRRVCARMLGRLCPADWRAGPAPLHPHVPAETLRGSTRCCLKLLDSGRSVVWRNEYADRYLVSPP